MSRASNTTPVSVRATSSRTTYIDATTSPAWSARFELSRKPGGAK
jgi:hypothetical protein